MVGAVGAGGIGMGGAGGSVGGVSGMAHVAAAASAASVRAPPPSLSASELSAGTRVSISVAARNVLANDIAQIGVKASAANSASGLLATGSGAANAPGSAINVNIDVNTLQAISDAGMFDEMMVALLLALLLQERNNSG